MPAIKNSKPHTTCRAAKSSVRAAYSNEPGYARHNLAALLAMNGEYAVRHPVIVAAILRELDALRRTGRLAWPKALEPGLVRQLTRLQGVTGDVAWPQRNCPVLRAAR